MRAALDGCWYSDAEVGVIKGEAERRGYAAGLAVSRRTMSAHDPACPYRRHYPHAHESRCTCEALNA